MALNAAQLARRGGMLTGSRIGCLMRGDRLEINQLYLEMIGEALPVDLSDNFQVQLGSYTEPFHLDWYERTNRLAISRRGDFVRHYSLPWAGVTLDGWIDDLHCPIEVKHCGGFDPIEIITERYQPQCQLAMEVTGADRCALSVIMGTRDPAGNFVVRDEDYAAEMVARGKQFMWHVETKTPPVELPAVPAPIDAKAIYDMTGNNAWADQAAAWLETREATAKNAEAAKLIKLLVPDDAHRCDGHGVYTIRNKAGTLSLREMKS